MRDVSNSSGRVRPLTPCPRPPRVSSSGHPSAEVPAFDVADAVTPVGGAPCARCHGPIVDAYFEADERVICAPCQQRLTTALRDAPLNAGVLRAAVFGGIAATVGAAAYVGVLALTRSEITVLAIAVGALVGKGVRVGAGVRGGRRFQWLAVVLSYAAIAATYAPFVLKGLGQGRLSVTEVSSLLLLALAAPVLESANSVLGIVIIGAALFVAWRLNRGSEMTITGPFHVRSARRAA